MSKARALLVLAFILVCAAGVVVGTAVDRTARPVLAEKPRESYSQKLGLTPEQERQMHDIILMAGERVEYSAAGNIPYPDRVVVAPSRHILPVGRNARVRYALQTQRLINGWSLSRDDATDKDATADEW